MAKGEGVEGVVKSDEESPDLDQYAKDALDELFSKEEQSYEEFLQGFMFLKKDDVTGIKTHCSHHHNSQNGTTCHKEKATNDVGVQSSLSTESDQLTENDHIPEEVLGPGSTSVPILMRTAESSSGAILQVDNFVECEDELTDDEEDGREENQKLNSLLEDDILSSNYSPSVLSFSKTKAVDDPGTQHPYQKVDLDDESHKAAKEICYLSEDVSTLPGEVDDHETTEQQDTSCEVVLAPNIRQLQITTRINNCDETNEQNNLTGEDEDSDEVQLFTLDTDFDYDNVALTPKFSFAPKLD